MDLELFRNYVLALMMMDLKFLAMASAVLKPLYFENALEQHVVRFLIEHFRETKSNPDKMALLSRASKYFKSANKAGTKISGASYVDVSDFVDTLEELQEAAAKQYVYVKAELVKYCREQALKDAIIASVGDIEKKEYGKIKSRITSALSVGVGLENRGVFLLADSDQRQSVEEIRKPIRTGFKAFDDPSKGGLGRGELGLIQAPPNTGKTTALVNIGAGAAKLGAKVAHISCEMKDALIINMYERCWLKKSDQQLNGLDPDGRALISKFFQKVRKNLKSDIAVRDFPSNRLTIDDLYGYLIMLESSFGFKPDMVILDYLDIMAKPIHISKETHEQQDWLVLELRAMAIELDVALWTATQNNRGSLLKETSGLEDVGGGFTKGAHADIVITLNQNQQEQKDEMLRAFWAKNRYGKKFITYTFLTDFDRARLEPV